jgi:zinc transport system substrate-binding protein
VNTSRVFKERYIRVEGAITHSHGPGGKHAHEGIAFTTWLDLDLAAKQAKAVADALGRNQPKLRGTFQENYAALEKDLMSLDRSIKQIISKNQTKPIIGSHPVYQYFARRYGLNMKSVHWEPDELPSDAQWSELRRMLEKHPAKWMVWEGGPMKASVQKLKSIGVDSLVFDPCGNTPDQGDFVSVMRRNVENLRRAFH